MVQTLLPQKRKKFREEKFSSPSCTILKDAVCFVSEAVLWCFWISYPLKCQKAVSGLENAVFHEVSRAHAYAYVYTLYIVILYYSNTNVKDAYF